MSWEQSSILFRRKPTHDLPLFISDSYTSKNKTTFNKFNLKYYFFIFSLILFFICFIYCLYLLLNNSFYSSQVSSNYNEKEPIISMEQIIKRHPYKLLEPSTGQKIHFNSNLLKQIPKGLDSWGSKQSNDGNIESIKKFASVDNPPGEGGNIIFFSFHGKVSNSIIMKTLEKKYNQFIDGGDFLLQRYLKHNMTVEDKWASYNPDDLTGTNKLKISKYIESIFEGYGGSRLEKRKMLSVHMTDAWEGGVEISWLISEFQRVGKVTHVIIISRNPLRAKISDIVDHKYKNILTDANTCEDRSYLFEINSVEAIEMVVAQHSGIKEAISVDDLNIHGVSYETDIQSNTLSTINSIVKFIWDKTLSTPILLESGDIPFTPHLRCDLSSELVNFKELECLLSTSPLRWIIYDQETSHLTFDQIIETGDLFIEWVEKDRQNDLIRAKTCSKISSVDSKISKQINQFLVRKRFDRCGHGGHSQTCRGFGPMKELSCLQLLKLTSSQSKCNLLTYTNKECYLHDSNAFDYWEGDCLYRNSYFAISTS